MRLGSKSTSKTSSLLLSAQRSGYQRSRESWSVIDRLKTYATEQCDALKGAFGEYLNSQPSFPEIQEYLEFSEDGLRFFEAFVVPTEDDHFKRVGKAWKEAKEDYLYTIWRAGLGPGIFKQYALRYHQAV